MEIEDVKNDISASLQAFKCWLEEDNTWDNVLDCEPYGVAEISVNHFVRDLTERIQGHVEEHEGRI